MMTLARAYRTTVVTCTQAGSRSVPVFNLSSSLDSVVLGSLELRWVPVEFVIPFGRTQAKSSVPVASPQGLLY